MSATLKLRIRLDNVSDIRRNGRVSIARLKAAVSPCWTDLYSLVFGSSYLTMAVSYYIGFDPGAIGKVGWAVAVRDASAKLPRVVAYGCAPNVVVAVENSLKIVEGRGKLRCVGIDSPLFWTPTGTRRVDAVVRRSMHERGAVTPSGTVQQLNSLRGACLVQGIAAGHLIRQYSPRVLLTETHPKALLWLLGFASPSREPADVTLSNLAALVITTFGAPNENERDAIISCGAAFAMHSVAQGWCDILRHEPQPLFLIPGNVAYWMPLDQIDEPVYR